MSKVLKDIFSGKKVLITGNTGFKGSWLSIWLQQLGAEVIGYSLEAPTTPNLFELAHLEKEITHIHGDVRNLAKLAATIEKYQPQVIYHLAAQPIVLHSFDQPLETFEINAMGTANLLESCRDKPFIEAIVIITTDKCYDNKEWVWGYRENDPLGGHDPYSASKAMTELVTASYRSSFFSQKTPIATARAGNVIGGGDFSEFRLIPDSMKALLNKTPIEVRNPHSTRPWMHVLDPLYGYLMLGKKLLEHGSDYAEAWNFGPLEHKAINTATMVEKTITLWGEGDWVDASSADAKPEMNILKLNWDKAATRLEWFPTYHWDESLSETVKWFKSFEKYSQDPLSINIKDVCIDQIETFTKINTARSNLSSVRKDEVYTHTT